MSGRELEHCNSEPWTCFLDYYDNQVSIIRKALAGCRTTFASEAFHDFRVGVKRLRALAELVAWINPQFNREDLRKALKPVYRATGVIRDLHVRMELVRNHGPHLVTGLSEFYNNLKYREIAARAGFARVDRRFDPDILQRFQTTVADCLSGFDDNLLLFRAEAMFHDLLNRLLGGRTKDEATGEDYHQMRMLAKKTRYVLEVIRQCNTPSDTLDRLDTCLRDLHRALGAWRDRTVACDSLELFRHEYSSALLRDEHAYADFVDVLSRESRAHLDRFPELVDKLKANWDVSRAPSEG